MAGAKPKGWAIGALVLSGAALGFDKFVLTASAGDEAPAASVAASDSAGAPPAQGAESRGRVGNLGNMFDARAGSITLTDSEIASAFGVPAAAKRGAALPGDTDEAEPRRDLGLRLTGVLRRPEGDLAIVNGRTLGVGQSAGDITVTAITETSVELSTPIGPVTLTIGRPTLAK
jgi:hypothetical protein